LALITAENGFDVSGFEGSGRREEEKTRTEQIGI
jgi:hypothetical protein